MASRKEGHRKPQGFFNLEFQRSIKSIIICILLRFLHCIIQSFFHSLKLSFYSTVQGCSGNIFSKGQFSNYNPKFDVNIFSYSHVVTAFC